jgi:hypothetical protein
MTGFIACRKLQRRAPKNAEVLRFAQDDNLVLAFYLGDFSVLAVDGFGTRSHHGETYRDHDAGGRNWESGLTGVVAGSESGWF